MKKIALQNLEVLLSSYSHEYVHGLIPESTLYEAASAQSEVTLEIPTKLFPYMNDAEIFERLPPDFLSQLKNMHLLLGNIPSKKLVQKLKKLKITPITQDVALNHRWEDKNFFHSICAKYNLPTAPGMIVRSTPPLFKKSCVLQEPGSYGGFGTYVAHTESEYKKITSKLKKPYLYKEFLHGIPFGVTLLISAKKGVLFSAVRMQASIKIRDQLIYHGIQWIPRSELSKKAIDSIESSLNSLAKALKKEKFFGIANVDFMLCGNECFFIEINPRLSGATWQLSQHPELLHGKHFLPLYEKSVMKKSFPSIPKLPSSTFKGATFDFDSLLSPKEVRTRKSLHGAGVYIMRQGSLKFLAHRVKTKKHEFFILPAVTKGNTLSQALGAGVLLSPRQLYRAKGNHISFTPLGSKVRSYSKKILF